MEVGGRVRRAAPAQARQESAAARPPQPDAREREDQHADAHPADDRAAGIFRDRQVLVEAMEPAEERRAEINDFEQQLRDFGIIVVKFWLQLSADEQLRRFKDREVTPYKQYKLTEEDWRNRAKWEAYEAAACDMIEKTSTEAAPWVLVEADNKEWARLKVLRTVAQRLRDEL